MSKIYFRLILLFFLSCLYSSGTAKTIERSIASNAVVSTDTLFYLDFNLKPATFTAGDYDIITVGSTSSKTVNGIIFCGGSYGERIHIKTTAAVTASGNYSPATSDDSGAKPRSPPLPEVSASSE